MNDLSTKEKILHLSHKLFADKGLNGVSVREIAKECDVNIAAINYHFKNKENLYWETIKGSIVQTTEEIRILYESLDKKSIDIFILAVFNHFLLNSEDLRTTFKLIISSERFEEAMGEDTIHLSGPPGGQYFALCLKDEIPSATVEDLEWGVRVLYTHVIHKALMLCNKSICDSLAINGLGQDVLQEDISRLVKIIKQELKDKKFKEENKT